MSRKAPFSWNELKEECWINRKGDEIYWVDDAFNYMQETFKLPMQKKSIVRHTWDTAWSNIVQELEIKQTYAHNTSPRAYFTLVMKRFKQLYYLPTRK